MPIYEYKCRKCGKQFEVMQGITDDMVKECKFCKGPVDKLISLSSFQLKGTGWYVTDYGGKKPSTAHEAQEETKAETKADTPSVPETSKTSKE